MPKTERKRNPKYKHYSSVTEKSSFSPLFFCILTKIQNTYGLAFCIEPPILLSTQEEIEERG